MARQSGLTLIEMLIAMVIMSAVMMLSAEAYRFYIDQSEAGSERLEQQFQQMRNLVALQNQISAAYHYFIPSTTGAMVLGFEGQTDQLTWVATTSIQRQDHAAVSWLGSEDNQLMYCEVLLAEQLIMALPEPAQLCQSFQLIIGEVDDIRFQFYGWPSFLDRLELGGGGLIPSQQTWYPSFSGAQKRVLPDAIRLTYQSRGVEHALFANLPNLDPGRTSYAVTE